MKILAIETSCDETAIALVEATGGLKNPQFKILENLVASQIKIHRPFGGVVPNLAKREHLRNLPILFKKLVASGHWLNPDLIAVTVGPGLEPALWTGVNFARKLYADLRGLRRGSTRKNKIKLIGVNHLEGHLYSNILKNIRINKKGNFFPAIALVISGGHTSLLLMKDLTHYKKLGETRDDAVGESFDKVARLLNLPYLGGPEIEKLAKKGNPKAIEFPRPMIHQKNYDFSFSGLKTAVLYYLRGQSAELRGTERGTTQNFISVNLRNNQRKSAVSKADIAASFQEAAFDVLITKALNAAKEFRAKSIMVSGGVAANKTLQNNFKKRIKIAFTDQYGFKRGLTQMIPKLVVTDFPTDNAVMIAAAAYINYLQKKNRKITAQANLNL